MEDRAAYERGRVRSHRPDAMKSFERGLVEVVMGRQRDQFTIVAENGAIGRTAKIDGTADNRVKDRLNVACRAADYAQNVAHCGVLL
jgi:hypothetical protein